MIKAIAIGVALHIVSALAKTQTDPSVVNALYFEALGSGILFSFNYDIHFKNGYGVRIGGFPAFGSDAYWMFAQGIMLTNPDGTHHLEAGAGVGIFALKFSLFGGSSPDPPTPHPYVPITLGYRLQPPGGGFVFRLALTPFIGIGTSGTKTVIAPLYGGVAIGWAW